MTSSVEMKPVRFLRCVQEGAVASAVGPEGREQHTHEVPYEHACNEHVCGHRADQPDDDDDLEFLELHEFMPPIYCDSGAKGTTCGVRQRTQGTEGAGNAQSEVTARVAMTIVIGVYPVSNLTR